MQRSSGRRAAALAALALVAAACGSTATPDERAIAGSGTGPSASQHLGDETIDAGGTVAERDAASAVPGATGGTGQRAPGGQPPPGAPSAAPAQPREAPAPDSPLRVGYVVVDTTGLTAVAPDSEAAGQSSDASARAAHREMEALRQYAIDTGGVGGRPIEIIPIKITLQDGSNRARMEQHCLTATEDLEVDVLVDHSLFADENGWACFAAHRTTFVGVVSGTDQAFLRQMAPYLATAWPAADRSTHALVDGLVDARYFDDATLGVLVDDTPIGNRLLDAHLLPRLRALGVEPAEIAKLNPFDAGAAGSQGAAAVLKFKTEGITHVISLVSFYGYLAFSNQADSQGYYPRYAFGDFQGGAAVAAFYGSSTQNRDSVAVSSTPAYVIDEGKDEERSLSSDVDRDKTPPGPRRCLDIYTQYTGVDYYKGNSGRSLSYAFYCDHFLLWLDAARQVGATVTPDTWGEGLARLGDSYASTAVHSTHFEAGRFDGSSSYRVGVYSENTSCRCYVAITDWQPM